MIEELIASTMTEAVTGALRTFQAALDEATEQGLSRLLAVLEKESPVRSPLEVLYYDEAWVVVTCKHLDEVMVRRKLLEAALAKHECAPADFDWLWQSGLLTAQDLLP
ncbi:MAG: hypothetical protein Q8P12_02260, partial [bacterium]|nr:hypothetical protein [bacterium]